MFGNTVLFHNDNVTHHCLIYDELNKNVVVIYGDNSQIRSWGTAKVGVVDGKSIVFGDPVVFNEEDSNYMSATYANGKIVVMYVSAGTEIHVIVGESISFGSPNVISSNRSTGTSITYDSANNKIVAVWSDRNDSYKLKTAVGTISGNSISFGTTTDISDGNGQTYNPKVTYDQSSGKVVIAYRYNNLYGDDKTSGRAKVGTVTGDSISFGSPETFCDDDCVLSDNNTICMGSNGRAIIPYKLNTSEGYIGVVVGTVTGDTIGFGDTTVLGSRYALGMASVYDFSGNRSFISFSDGSLYVAVGSLTGTGISFEIFEHDTETAIDTSIVYDSDNETIAITYPEYNSPYHGFATVASYAPDDFWTQKRGQYEVWEWV